MGITRLGPAGPQGEPHMVDVTDHGAVGDGVTDDTAAIQAAIDEASSVGGEGVVFFPAGHFRLDASELLVDADVRFQGAGSQLSFLVGGKPGGTILRKSSTTQRSIEICDLTFDVENNTAATCLRVQYVNRFALRRCRFLNATAWGVLIGVDDGTDAFFRNRDVLVEDCDFDGLTGTMEQLLLMNSEHVVVRGCRFNPTESTAIALGLYQNLRHVTVERCQFEGVGKGVYYSLSCEDLAFHDCFFGGRDGITGANQSDNGTFGATIVRGLTITGSLFECVGESSSCLEIGAVHGATVVGNVFRAYAAVGIHITSGNSPVNAASRAITITGNAFVNGNQSGVSHGVHPGILVAMGASADLDLTIMGNTFTDDQAVPTQYYPITFSGPFIYQLVVIIGNNLKPYGTGRSLHFDNGAQLGNLCRVHSNMFWEPPTGFAETTKFRAFELQVGTGVDSSGTYVKVGNLNTPDGWIDVASSNANAGLHLRAKGTGIITAESPLTIADGKNIGIGTTTGSTLGAATSKLGFFGATPVSRPTVTGSRASGEALQALLAALADLGLIEDDTAP